MNRKKIVVLTGAGMSAESGLKTFRDSDGLWENHRIEDVATRMAWESNMQLVLDFYNQRRKDVLNAEPNAGHKAIVKLEERFDVTVITQNIDDLHERAGSSNVMHLHGEILKARSTADSHLLYDWRKDISPGDMCEKGSQLRPHIVWFHEPVPMIELAQKETTKADILIVVGTSLQVYPAAGLILYAPQFAKKFLIDPKIPDVSYVRNITCIARKASDGMEALLNDLMN